MADNKEDKKPIEDKDIIRSGMLDVGDGHEIYWIDWGNKNIKEPIFYLHGGPGSGIQEKDFLIFDPKKHRVIFHDQRGSGRSTPFASIENNTTDDLISDITKLRQELGFDKTSLYGFSWGSTLALMYAIHNPEVVSKMLIGGIFLARRSDNDFYLGGRTASHFPEAWAEFVSHVPDNQKQNPAAYYKEKLFTGSEAVRAKFARAWMKYEASILRLDYKPKYIEHGLKDFAFESLAYLEAHYILNGCFIQDNYIIENIDKIKHIPCVIVHGRYDFICTPQSALELADAYGDNAILHLVMAGHSRGDTVQNEVVQAYLKALW